MLNSSVKKACYERQAVGNKCPKINSVLQRTFMLTQKLHRKGLIQHYILRRASVNVKNGVQAIGDAVGSQTPILEKERKRERIKRDLVSPWEKNCFRLGRQDFLLTQTTRAERKQVVF